MDKINFANGSQPAINDINLNQLQTNIENAINQAKLDTLKLAFPIGQPYITQTNTNPSEILGFGTWVRSKGKVLLGVDEDDEDFNTIGKTGGEKTHTLTIAETPSHTHQLDVAGTKITKANPNMTAGSTTFWNMAIGKEGEYDLNLDSVGGGQAHNNMQPYQVVGYVWIREA